MRVGRCTAMVAALAAAGVCTFVWFASVRPQTVRANATSSSDVRIGVMGLFHPTQFTVTAPAGVALTVRVGGENIVLEKSSGVDSANASISGSEVTVSVAGRIVHGAGAQISGRNGEAAHLILAIPNKIRRRYYGRLEIGAREAELSAIITMDRETAVASVVAAESLSDAPLEAMKAQAVAARSYLVAGRGRHEDFDFCDTTHCQFLREPPLPESVAARAAADTKGLVLTYETSPIAAMYTRSCSGRTRTPAQVGLRTSAYPYYSVECKFCRMHPVRWSSRLSKQDVKELHGSDEAARLDLGRRLGWSAVPGNDYVERVDGDEVVVEGSGEGHGIGLCQAGARAMARSGADFRQILSHYYPNTKVGTWGGER